jgi:hypothetical protein
MIFVDRIALMSRAAWSIPHLVTLLFFIKKEREQNRLSLIYSNHRKHIKKNRISIKIHGVIVLETHSMPAGDTLNVFTLKTVISCGFIKKEGNIL